MAPKPRTLGAWDGKTALLLDGGAGPRERPTLHLQAGPGRRLRLVGPHGPSFWAQVEECSYGVHIVRSSNEAPRVLAPIDATRAASMDDRTRWVWWLAAQLCASPTTPLARGRCMSFERSTTFDGLSRRRMLGDLLTQGAHFDQDWPLDDSNVILLRELSDGASARVKMWRKFLRRRRLPPVVAWWCSGLHAHVLLDGHDRLHAALLEGVRPDVMVLTDLRPRATALIDDERRDANERANELAYTPPAVTNLLLSEGWDERRRWRSRSPAFPLEGGDLRWEAEVRGTPLEDRPPQYW